MIFVDADLKLVGEEVLWGTLDNEDNLLAAIGTGTGEQYS